MCEKVVPGNRVTVLGIYAIKKFGMKVSIVKLKYKEVKNYFTDVYLVKT